VTPGVPAWIHDAARALVVRDELDALDAPPREGDPEALEVERLDVRFLVAPALPGTSVPPDRGPAIGAALERAGRRRDWYRVGDDLEAVRAFLRALLRHLPGVVVRAHRAAGGTFRHPDDLAPEARVGAVERAEFLRDGSLRVLVALDAASLRARRLARALALRELCGSAAPALGASPAFHYAQRVREGLEEAAVLRVDALDVVSVPALTSSVRTYRRAPR
jgi:hypothetical protein